MITWIAWPRDDSSEYQRSGELHFQDDSMECLHCDIVYDLVGKSTVTRLWLCVAGTQTVLRTAQIRAHPLHESISFHFVLHVLSQSAPHQMMVLCCFPRESFS